MKSVESSTRSKVGADAEPNVKPSVESKTESSVKPGGESRNETDIEPNIKPGIESKTKPGVESKADLEAAEQKNLPKLELKNTQLTDKKSENVHRPELAPPKSRAEERKILQRRGLKSVELSAGERKKRRQQRWKTVNEVIWALLLVGVTLIGTQLVVAWLMHSLLKEAVQQPLWQAIYDGVVYGLSLVIVLGVSIKLLRQPTTRNRLGLRGLPTWTDIGLALVGFLAYVILAALLIGFCSSLFPGFSATETQELGFPTLMSGGDRVLAMIALVFVAPLAEELLFRGWLYGRLRTLISGKKSLWIAILLTSLLFAALHFQWNVAVNVFALSLVLCGLREITGTIYGGILLHMLKNAVAFYFLYFRAWL